MFDLALMFAHADLKAVKVDDSFHDTLSGDGRVNFKGKLRTFGKSADEYGRRIRGYIDELAKTQPLLPVTKMPKSSTIRQRIKRVNSDGSTNLKGVYQDKDGLIVIKYNEVEDWEALGFPKGSKSRGIKAKGSNSKRGNIDVNTGNIHFFVHAIDPNRPINLSKFDGFSMVDSDAVLSVSYAERPESKFKFFKTQGILLDVDTKDVHGGGNTDMGSGFGKDFDELKRLMIFEGGNKVRERYYIPNLIKEATGMSDSEYVKFVKKYENKPFTEIEPEEVRNKIIKIFAEINSKVRKNGERSYNEMYISNPSDIMGVFGYPENLDRIIGNIWEFIKSNDALNGYLRKYAIEHDIPMYLFGY